MASRESQVAAYLRADSALLALLTGGIWADESLGTEGITSPKTTAAAYAAGELLPCCVVKQRGETDDPRIVDEGEHIVGESIVVECWLYQRVASDAIRAAKDRIYTLLQGHGLTGAWKMKRVFTLATQPEPTMTGVKVGRVDYMIVSVHKPS